MLVADHLSQLLSTSVPRRFPNWTSLLVTLACAVAPGAAHALDEPATVELIRFAGPSGTLGGELFLPRGNGPFPALLYNHGSAPGMLNSETSRAIGPLFAARGWVFFMPYRRGQGLSAQAGRFIGDEIADARQRGGRAEAAQTMARLLGSDHLQDQLAALQWLRAQAFVQLGRVAVAGNSFGGIEAVLGAASATYCAAVDASGGAESWSAAPPLQDMMKAAVRTAHSPVLFFQAENDFDLSPSRTLLAEMKAVGKHGELKIYPAFGESRREGHSFAYRGASTWFEDVFAFLNAHCPP
jgi:dienelactone hydrolase